MASSMMQPQIILLKEGTDTSQGKAQLISNINACIAVVDIVRSTLGPRGMDKLIHHSRGVTISNDGATIMNLLDIVHPAAKSLVDISLSQDAQVGDGTTTVVILAGSFLHAAKPFIEEGVHPRNIISSFRQACNLAVEQIKDMSVSIGDKTDKEKKEMLVKCAMTSLNSKLVSGEKEFFANMVVDAVTRLDPRTLDLKLVGVKKVTGGGLRDSFLVDGVAFKKTFSYAGFEQQPKSFDNPKILVLNIELELKSEKENAEIRLDDPAKYQSIVDAEWNIIYDKLQKCADSGAQIVLSRLAIGDLGTQFFADRNIFCAGRVPMEDLARVSKATGAKVQTTVNNLDVACLGQCGRFDERQVGGERYNLFTECEQARTATIVLRGGSEQFIDEAERSLHDAVMIVRRALKNSAVVPGGGANDMEVSKHLRDFARTIPGKSQLFINAYAKAMEVIPRQLCDNAGFDATDVLNRLRQKHALANNEGRNFGMDVNTGGVVDTFKSFVWEPSVVKVNAIQAATEAACLILSIDETVKNPKSEQPGGGPMPGGGRGMRGRGRGRGRGRF
ncbi:hypothetical protein BSKO_01168 [Bryopsis sp. KO-2023]|nr:hypothetical protein BSKO_01168 [Bryopsis sp. KO-2023]